MVWDAVLPQRALLGVNSPFPGLLSIICLGGAEVGLLDASHTPPVSLESRPQGWLPGPQHSGGRASSGLHPCCVWLPCLSKAGVSSRGEGCWWL